MNDLDHDYESIRNFIDERLMFLARQQESENEEATLQGVTVRLPSGDVALMDFFSKNLDYSRQNFMRHLIASALNDVCKAWVSGRSEADRENVSRLLFSIRYKNGEL